MRLIRVSVREDSPTTTFTIIASSMLSGKQSLSTFPFLTAGEFDCACRFFLDRIRGSESPGRLGWSAVRLEDLVIPISNSYCYNSLLSAF